MVRRFNSYKKVLLTAVVLLSWLFINIPLEAHGTGKHSEQIGYVLFGYSSAAELNASSNEQTKRAYELIRRAVAVAIDNKGIKNDDYKNLGERLRGSSIRIPVISEEENKEEENKNELLITNKYHRQVCHQGFDYKYKNPESDKRWNGVGRKFLIDVVREAFSYKGSQPNDATATFIAMIAYYTHILGDLEEGETKSMSQNGIGTFSGFSMQFAQKIDSYGKDLANQSSIKNLVKELKKLNMPSGRADQLGSEFERCKYSSQIFNVLSKYIPRIIQNNVDPIFKINTNIKALPNVA